MLIRRQGERLAIYRSATGMLRALGAACPSGRGHVRWNGAEKSWDCPSCGSRFDLAGAVLNGPAVRGLMPRPFPDAKACPHRPRPRERSPAVAHSPVRRRPGQRIRSRSPRPAGGGLGRGVRGRRGLRASYSRTLPRGRGRGPDLSKGALRVTALPGAAAQSRPRRPARTDSRWSRARAPAQLPPPEYRPRSSRPCARRGSTWSSPRDAARPP